MFALLTPRSHILGIAVTAALLGAVAVASPAGASTKPGGAATAGWHGHCVMKVVKGSNQAASETCFSTFTQAISYATGGAVTDAPATPTAATAAATTAKINAANSAARASTVHPLATPPAPFTVGTEYSEPNYAGWTLTVAGPAACTPSFDDVDYSVDLPSPIWDQISSFKTYNICWADHFYLSNFAGYHTGYQPGQPTMPPMSLGGTSVSGDNNARSIAWT